MSVILNCREITKSYTSVSLFEDLNLSIDQGDRLGMIGPNGVGKSSLLKIMAGIEPVDRGEVVTRKGLTTAYVPQMADYEPGQTIGDILREAAQAPGLTPADIEARVHVNLGLAGFDGPDTIVGTLSGGWRKRLTIACGLVQEADLMLLDEPTNHLDVRGVLWLEDLLARASFTWVMVSHDRWFIGRTTTRVTEMNPVFPGGAFNVQGNYERYLTLKDEFLESQAQHQASLANKVRRETEWLRRGAKARTTKAKSRIDQAGKLIEELDEVRSRTRAQDEAGIDLTGTGRKTKKLIEVKQAAKQLGGRTIIKQLDLLLSPGRRIGLLGENGAGKTTILKLLTKELEPDQGQVYHVDNLKLVTFDQNRASLDPEQSLKDALSETGDSVLYRGNSIHVISWAKRFRFEVDQLPIPVGSLSGGEQARLLIAKLMLQPADVLIMDEPTNDLDIPTLEVLEESLNGFPGALVLVTHDRYMLDRVCDSFIGLDGQGGWARYGDYRQWETSLDQPKAGKAEKIDKPAKENTPKAERPKKLSYKDQRDLETIEERIEAAEAELARCQAAAEDPAIASRAEKLMEAYAALEEAQAEVDRLYQRWDELEGS